jgi:hypothetical protein
MSNATLYERDFYGWIREQTELLRGGRLAEADIANIAEEIESMGRRERRELVNRLAVLLLHLLKWSHQPELRCRSWRLTVEEQRRQLARHLQESPSLAPFLDEAIAAAYGDAVLRAERETNLLRDMFPWSCPFTPEQIMGSAFWPE